MLKCLYFALEVTAGLCRTVGQERDYHYKYWSSTPHLGPKGTLVVKLMPRCESLTWRVLPMWNYGVMWRSNHRCDHGDRQGQPCKVEGEPKIVDGTRYWTSSLSPQVMAFMSVICLLSPNIFDILSTAFNHLCRYSFVAVVYFLRA